jgi:hypothetical protein
VEGLLGRLAAALVSLGVEAGSYRQRQTALNNHEVSLTAGRDADPTRLEELRVLLETQDLAALEQFKSLSLSLSELLGAMRFGRLREAIDNLDFQQAAQLLREAHLMGSLVPAAVATEQRA